MQELENAVKSTVTEINDTNAALKKARDSKDIDFLRDNLLKLRDALKQLRDELTRACTASCPFHFLFWSSIHIFINIFIAVSVVSTQPRRLRHRRALRKSSFT